MPGKFALVMGNSDYAGDARLVRPKRDSAAFAAVLRELGFDVTIGVDLVRSAADEAVTRFIDTLSTAKAEVSVLYFSGHGMQLQDRNYILPIDFTDGVTADRSKMVEVQPIIDRMSRHSDVRLILLDACRNNPGAMFDLETTPVDGARSLDGVEVARVISQGADKERISGLANMKADQDTFIAFSASPGGFAYEGSRQLSPFTEALVRHVDAIDLPLSNLMSRVRRSVKEQTGGRQRTWDQSSLILPFYFNPGSLLLFLGNMMALVGLLLSLVPYSLVLATGSRDAVPIAASALLPAISMAVLLVGMQGAYSRLRGRFADVGEEDFTVRDHLASCLRKGWIGGYLGALIGSFPLSIPYHLAWVEEVRGCVDLGDCFDVPGPLGTTMTEIVIATALVAGLLGSSCLFLTRARWIHHRIDLLKSRTWWQTLAGAACGGMLSGLVAAPLLVMYFGRLHRPAVTPDRLLPGTIIGSSILIFSIVNFDFERLSRRRILTSLGSSATALAAGLVAAVAVFGPLYLAGVVGAVTDALQARYNDIETLFRDSRFEDIAVVLGGSVAYGLPAGLVLGITIGVAIALTERWSTKPII